jgi:hypothetical protein
VSQQAERSVDELVDSIGYVLRNETSTDLYLHAEEALADLRVRANRGEQIEVEFEELCGAIEGLLREMERGSANVRSDDWYFARDVAQLAVERALVVLGTPQGGEPAA